METPPRPPALPTPDRRQAGFSLVELAIVLIIIGIILGAVTKGRDLIRSSEQKKIFTQFVNAWSIGYQTYHERTGLVLGDQTSATNDSGGTRNGQVEASMAQIDLQLRNVGLTPPPDPGLGNGWTYSYQDGNGNAVNVTVSFAFNTTWGNHMRLTDSLNGRGIPSDLGIALDTLADGRADGTAGDFLYTADAASGTAASAWPGMVDGSGNPTTPVGAAAAIWRMPF